MEKKTWKHGDIDMGVWKYGEMETWRQGNGDMDMETWRHQMENGKRKPRRFSSIRLPFAHRAKNCLSFCPFVDEETYESYPFANGLNGLNGLNILAHLCK
jgi:hypothetical protein